MTYENITGLSGLSQIKSPTVLDTVYAPDFKTNVVQPIANRIQYAIDRATIVRGNPFGTPINASFTGASPTVIANSSFTITGITGNPVLRAEFWPVFVDNTASAADCHILVQYQNGGSWTTADDYLVPQNTSRSFTPMVPDIAVVPSTVSLRLAAYNNSVANSSIKSMSSAYLAKYSLFSQ